MRSRLALLPAVLCCAVALAPCQQIVGGKIPPPEKEAFVVEHVSTTITVEDDGRNVAEHAAQVHIQSDAGIKAFALITLPYASASQAMEVEYVRVRKPDGTVVVTPDYNVQEMSAEITRQAPMYSDAREKHIAVKALGVGDVLEYKFRIRTLKPDVPGQFWYAYTPLTDQVIQDERISISLPAGKHVKVKSPELKPDVKTENGRTVYTWTRVNLERKSAKEVANPLRGTPPPVIQVTTFNNWEEIGRWYAGLAKDRAEVTPGIAAKAKALTTGLTTDEAKLHAIYNFVSMKIHYVGLDFGIGRYQPHAAQEVLENEYGDCKDKHTLLAALLKAAGYDAWPVLIHSEQRLDADVPSPGQFDHVITLVPRGDTLVWLDTTPEVAPYGLILLYGRQALVVPTNKAPLLMTTPADSAMPMQQVFEAKAKLGADGLLKGHIVQRFRGAVEVIFRSSLRQVPEAQWQEAVQRVSRALGFGGEVSNVVIKNLDDLDQPLEIAYDYTRKNYADWEHHQILTLLPAFGLEAQSYVDEAPKEPVFLGMKGEARFSSEIELPAGTSLTPRPDENIVEPWVEYHTQNSLRDGVLRVTRRLVIKQTEAPVADWPRLKKMAKVANDDVITFLPLSGLEEKQAEKEEPKDLNDRFREGYNALQSRDFSRAKELLLQVIKEDPQYKQAHSLLAAALMAQGDLPEALERLREEEKINPTETRTYQAAAQVAMLLQQLDEAAAEWRKLLKLEPHNRKALQSLCAMLNAAGKYGETVAALEPELKDAQDDASLRYSLGYAYANNKQPEQARPHLQFAAEAALKASPVDYMQLNNIAYTMSEAGMDAAIAQDYAEKALAAMDARSTDDAAEMNVRLKLTHEYGLVWDTAGWIYFKTGDLKRAESYVRAAWLLTQGGAEAEHLGEIYEKVGRVKEAAHLYELAYATTANPLSFNRMGTPAADPHPNKEQANILERYRKLTGKAMTPNATSRLPNGKWSMLPGEELSRMRTAELGKEPGPSESADFDGYFTAGKPPKMVFHSGSNAMKSLTTRLEKAPFQLEIPAGSHATLVRRVTVVCSKYAPCSAVLTPVENMVAQIPN